MKPSGSPACSTSPAASVANRSAKADPAQAAAGLAATSSSWQSSRSAFCARLAALRAASSAYTRGRPVLRPPSAPTASPSGDTRLPGNSRASHSAVARSTTTARLGRRSPGLRSEQRITAW